MTMRDPQAGRLARPPSAEADEVFDATGIAQRALRVGDEAPDATLSDALGHPMRLADRWGTGPLVIVFYRGGWCGYCSLQLRAWQRHAGDLARLGASLVAISPQTPANSMSTVQQNALAFTVLSDSALEAANGFGLAYTLHPDLVDYYGSVGTDVPVLNGNGQWVLPVPATYVVDGAGTVRFAWIDEDVRSRVEPADVIAAVEALRLGRRIGAHRSTP
jgi:peroxiredoxin